MRCEEIREIIAEQLSGSLTEVGESRLQEHLSQCPGCSEDWADVKNIWSEMEQFSVPLMAHESVRMRVLSAVTPPGFQFFKWRLDMKEIVKAAAIVVILAGLATGATLFVGRRHSDTPPVTANNIAPVRGSATAPVTLVEYGDYECPPCFPYEQIVRRLLEKYPGTLKFEFRHFPLTGPHPHALAAAKAADAAGQQGKFWEMHDALMASRKQWSDTQDAEPFFLEKAEQLGLDMKLFRESFHAAELEQRILKQRAAAEATGINATPSFLINDKKIEPGPPSFEDIDNRIAEELRQLKKAKAEGH